MSELSAKKAAVKEMIKQLHEGANVDAVKEEFKGVLRLITPTEISLIEGELVDEGMAREELERLCDVHLEVFREALERDKALAPAGHPIHILMTEHNLILGYAEELRSLVKAPGAPPDAMGAKDPIEHLRDSANHYTREENVLFPYLEKHGITQPPAIMWNEHNQIREIEKDIFGAWDGRGGRSWEQVAREMEPSVMALAEMLSSHFYKENHILFPTSLKVMQPGEWQEARREFDEIGYTGFTPRSALVLLGVGEAPVAAAEPQASGVIALETGSFTVSQLEALFRTLPVDLTFVGKDDTVQFFSLGPDRIFTRTKAVIGREVQKCHPQKSVHVVTRILDDFRAGTRDHADFWIDLNGRLIYIRYFAVRDEQGEYLGCLEVVQDATEIRQLQGEKRLLD